MTTGVGAPRDRPRRYRYVGPPEIRAREHDGPPGDVDLKGQWRRLGVREEDGRIRFDAAAPLAHACAGITAVEASS